METLKFTPKVFRITNEYGVHGVTTWDILTVDGETPSNTVYFLRNNESTSISEDEFISNAIENGNFEEITLVEATGENEFDLNFWDIDLKVFEYSPDSYSEIIEALKN